MEPWKETIVGLTLGLVSVSSLIHIKRFIFGEDVATVNVYNPTKVEIPQERRVLDLETIANGFSETDDENVE